MKGEGILDVVAYKVELCLLDYCIGIFFFGTFFSVFTLVTRHDAILCFLEKPQIESLESTAAS